MLRTRKKPGARGWEGGRREKKGELREREQERVLMSFRLSVSQPYFRLFDLRLGELVSP